MDMEGARLGWRLGKKTSAWSSPLELELLSLFSLSSTCDLSLVDGLLVEMTYSVGLKSVSDSVVHDASASKIEETAEYWDELVEVRERIVLHMRGGRDGARSGLELSPRVRWSNSERCRFKFVER